MKPRPVTGAQLAEWERIIAEHTPISASDPCPTCGPVCEPTWQTQRRWAKEMLSIHMPREEVTPMAIKDYWAATPLTQPDGDEPEGETSPAVPDAEPRD